MGISKLFFPRINGESKISLLIWNMLLYWLIVDSITGYFLNSGILLPISQAYKLFLLILLFSQIIRQGSGLGLSFIIIYIIIYSIHIIIINEPISESLIHLSKILLTITLYIYFRNTIPTYPKASYIKRMDKILSISFIIVSINICSGIIGIGFHTYPDEKIGFKGFFYAGNEMGGLLAVLIPYILYKAFKTRKLSSYICTAIYCIILSILLATKSVIIISLVTAFFIPWLYGTKKIRFYIILTLILLAIISIPYIILLIDSQEFDLFVRLTYSYNKGGLSSLIFSSRDEFWINKSTEFFNSNTLIQILGLGGNRTVEMDQFDTLLNYGYLGVVLIYSFYIYIFYLTWKKRNYNSYSRTVTYSNIMLLGMSIIAGHILFSSMAGMYISLNNNISLIFNKKNNFFQ